MPRFPIAAYAALLPAEHRDRFAKFSHGTQLSVLRFVTRGFERAALELPLEAAPIRR